MSDKLKFYLEDFEKWYSEQGLIIQGKKQWMPNIKDCKEAWKTALKTKYMADKVAIKKSYKGISS